MSFGRVSVVLCAFGLAACGGGSAQVSMSPDPDPDTGSGTLSGQSPAALTSAAGQVEISGSALITSAGLADFVFAETVGLTTSATGALTLRDANYTFVSDGTFDTSGRLTDEDGAWLRFLPLNEHYGGARLYEGSYLSDENVPTSVFLGVMGPTVNKTPATGTANYSGEAYGSLESPTSSFRFDGRARVFADFAAAEVDVIIDQLNVVSGSSNATLAEIRVVDMTLSDGVYSGGALQTLAPIAGQPAIDILGPGLRVAAQGAFFAGDGTNAALASGGTLAGTGFLGAVAASWLTSQKE